MLVTTPELYRRKVQGLRDRLPGLRHVILVGDAPDEPGGVHGWDGLVERASADYTIAPTDPESMALLHFTSGTTGRPKGAVHVHGAVVAHVATGRYALDLHDDDVFWCTADPGWVTGTSYGIIAPLCNGVTSRRGRGRVRRPDLVRRAGARARQRLVHRADGDPHDDEAGRRGGARATTCRRCASWPAWASR